MKRKSLIRRLTMPLPELERYYRERRKTLYEQNIKLNNIELRKRIYPLFHIFLRIDRLFRRQSITVIGKNREFSGRVIFACTHIGQNDLENIYETIRHSCWWFLGDPKELYKDISGLLISLNGGIFLDTGNKTDRQIAYARSVELLQSNGSLMIFPEGARNGSENLPVMPLFPGTAKMAMETNTIIVPVAIEQYDKRFIIKFGDVLKPKEYNSSAELTQILRDSLATLKWDIWEQEGLQLRSSISTEYRKIFLEEFERRIYPYDTLESVERTRYHTKEELEQKDVFAHQDKLIPCMENAFLFRKGGMWQK